MVALLLTTQNHSDAIQTSQSDHHLEYELIEGLKAGKKESLEHLYKLYSAALLGIISRIVKIDEIAEDVLQETFLKIWKSIDQYNAAKGRLFTWMARLAKNTAIDQMRSKGQMNSSKNDDIGNVSLELDRNHQTQYNPETIGVKQLTQHLTFVQKQILDLVYFEGYTHTEVAEELNIPVGTVKTRIRMAIQTLRKYF